MTVDIPVALLTGSITGNDLTLQEDDACLGTATTNGEGVNLIRIFTGLTSCGTLMAVRIGL